MSLQSPLFVLADRVHEFEGSEAPLEHVLPMQDDCLPGFLLLFL